MTTILLSGFEPFNGQTSNPSWESIKRTIQVWTGSAKLVGVELPVDFAQAWPVFRKSIQKHEPVIVIAVGQAGGRTGVTLERIGINLMDARIPDNSGFQPIDQVIDTDGPAAYFSGLPVKAAVEAIQDLGLPASVSQTAGTFTCNYVLYQLMRYIDTSGDKLRGGFVHVPFSHDQKPDEETPSMSIDEISHALIALIQATLKYPVDHVLLGGAEH